jgi:exodeoxyribonuclease-3
MKFVSWNVNGLRACLNKGFMEYFEEVNADAICLQEIKLSEGQIELELENYHCYWNYAVKKGYSGTAIFTKHEPLSVSYGIGIEEHDQEGRVITLEYKDYFLVTCYTPNAKRGLERIEYREVWEDDFLTYLNSLQEKKGVILCGDLNVAHKEIDLKNPKANRKNAGFSDEERAKMTQLLEAGYIDTYRYFHPDREGAYTWWSYMGGARDRNVGWRIDYFIVSDSLENDLDSVEIHQEVMGSDHCPVVLTLK